MNTFLKIAVRNIIRNKLRSLITIVAVSFGLAALIFIRAFVEGADTEMIRNYTDLITSHIQIHKQEFHKKMGLERSIDNPFEIENTLKTTPDKIFFSKRIKDYALISSAEQSSGILLMGIEPANEKKVTKLYERVRLGKFLSEGKDDQIVLGKDLIEILNVSLGDKVVIMGQAADGSLAAGAYRVCGVLDTGGEEIDKGIALITLSAAKNLFVMEDKISEFAVRVDDVFEVDEVAGRLREKLNAKTFEVLTWKDIAPAILQWLEFDRAFINIILLVVLLVAAAGILNTVLMGVLERVREFGIMLAVGTKRRQVLAIVVLEAFLLGFAGVVIGAGLGVSVSVYLGRTGVSLLNFSSALENYYVGSVIYPRVFVRDIFVSAAVILITGVIVSVYPAWKAASLKPVDAIKHF